MIFKAIKRPWLYDFIPFGFTKVEAKYLFSFPLWSKHAEMYDAALDEKLAGEWRLVVRFAYEGGKFSVRKGWMLKDGLKLRQEARDRAFAEIDRLIRASQRADVFPKMTENSGG